MKTVHFSNAELSTHDNLYGYYFENNSLQEALDKYHHSAREGILIPRGNNVPSIQHHSLYNNSNIQ